MFYHEISHIKIAIFSVLHSFKYINTSKRFNDFKMNYSTWNTYNLNTLTSQTCYKKFVTHPSTIIKYTYIN